MWYTVIANQWETSLPKYRIIVPIYSDGFSFSLMAITDNGGKNWQFSEAWIKQGKTSQQK